MRLGYVRVGARQDNGREMARAERRSPGDRAPACRPGAFARC